MNEHENQSDAGGDSMNIGDENVGRLIGRAYEPQSPDSGFVRRVEAAMILAARERAESRDLRPAIVQDPSIRQRPASHWRMLAWSAAAATILAAVGFVVGRNFGRDGGNRDTRLAQPASPGRSAANVDGAADIVKRLARSGQTGRGAKPPSALVGDRGLTPRGRPPAPRTDGLAVGDSLETAAGERRRVTLDDGSVLFVNQNTRVTLDAERRLTLDAGEIYLEVAPRAQQPNDLPTPPATFVVTAPDREVRALGTKFAVRAERGGSSVLVTQGKVQVSDFDQPIAAGEQLAPPGSPTHQSASPISPLPRASHVLDWTQPLVAAAESPLVPASGHAGGSLVAVDPNGQEARLSLRKFHIDVHVEDGFARTTIDQTFFNHTSWRLEGTFHFPLPPDASLSRLAMYVEGKLMEGGMAERDYARQVFEQIVSRQKDPALLEWVDGSTFKMRVFPLEARQEKRIILSYSQRLDSVYGVAKYRFPAGHTLDRVRDWSFHARVRRGAELAWSCDSHELKDSKDGKDLVLDASAKEVKLDRDVVLKLTDRNVDAGDVDRSRFSAATHEGNRYLMLRFRPELPNRSQRQRRDWIFLFESSGDRDPVLARVQVDVIATLLKNAEYNDTFVILTAGTQTRVLAGKQAPDSPAGPRPEPLAATPENVKAAIERLETVHLVGALDLAGALAAVEPFVKGAENPTIVHVGAGVSVLGERREDELVKRIPAGARYVGVGVGKRWSRQFMKSAASRTGGYFTQINPDESVAWRAFDLYSTLNTPRLLNVSVVDSAERLTFLNYNDSLAHGEELCAIARLGANDQLPEQITVSGTLDPGAPGFRRVIAVENVADTADYLPRTWAKLRIDQLLADDAAKHKDEIIALSKAMYVMSPFTSLLVLENEQMYVQFNVDRGRKDHWAMYRCPSQIPVVYEPLAAPTQTAPAVTASDPRPAKPSAMQVLATIPVRFHSPSGAWPGTTSYHRLAETYLGLLACPDDSKDFERLIEIVQRTAAQTKWDDLNRLHVADRDRILKLLTFYCPSNRSEGVIETGLSHHFFNGVADYGMINGGVELLMSPYAGYRHVPGKVNINTTWDAEETHQLMDQFWALMPEESYREALTIARRMRDKDRETPLAMLPPFHGEMEGIVHDLNDLKEIRKHRVLLTLLQMGKSHIPFPDEPPIEYPDARWWEEMSKRRAKWARVDLTVPSKAEEMISSKLTDPVTLEFVETPLSDVVDFLRDYTDVNIVLDRVALDEEGVTSDTPVTIHVEQIALKSALKLLLGGLNLSYVIKDDVLQITSVVQARNELRHRVYPVGDLVVPVGRFLPHLGSSWDAESTGRILFGVGVNSDAGLLGNILSGNAPPLPGMWGNDELAAYRFPDLKRWEDLTDRVIRRELRIYPGDMLDTSLRRSEANLRRTRLFLDYYRVAPNTRDGTDLTYQRPAFQADARVFRDLIAYAPGMSATRADVLAVLASETEFMKKTPNVGDIEPLARTLIEKAHRVGWQAVTLPTRQGGTPLKIAFDGSGRYRYDWTTADGVLERVISDDVTLWHLYPELGIGAKRTASRFHRAELASLVPWLLPMVEELARDADLRTINDRTVAIVPRGTQPALPEVSTDPPEKSEKPAAGAADYWCIHLIFAQDGRLAERRLFVMPAGKVLVRETYAADGTVRLLDGDDNVLAEYKLAVEPAAEPDLTPDTKQLVVLPMPTRTIDHVFQTTQRPRDGRYDQWSEDDALRLLAASVIQDPAAAIEIVGRRFFAKGDRRVGFYALLLSSGVGWNPAEDHKLADGTGVRSDPVADHPNSTLARYVFLHQQQLAQGNKIAEMDLSTNDASDGFIRRLAAFRDIHARWSSGKLKDAPDAERQVWREQGLAFLRSTRSPSFRWLVLGVLAELGGDAQFQRSLAAAFREMADVPGLVYVARYQEARSLLAAGDRQEARELFIKLHAAALASGLIPPLDTSFRRAFEDGDGPAQWQSLMKSAATRLAGGGARPAVAALASQCHSLGDAALADELILAALGGVTEDDRLSTTLAAVGFYQQTDQIARANALFQPLLAGEELNRDPASWRIGADLAHRHGVTDRALACLDQAVNLEYERLPDVVHLEEVRHSFGELLGRFQQHADAAWSLRSRLPSDFVARLIRAADRWRSLDSDDTAACQAAARVLDTIGADDLAWEYLTTPLAARPAEPPPWLALAQSMREHKSFELAARAYARAFDAEPANAQILWDHAQMLQQADRPDAARPILERLADGAWDAKFEAIQSEARKSLGR